MPTATKVPKPKKIVPQENAHDTHEEADTIPEVSLTKNKKPLEIDELEPAVVGVDEKVEEDPLVAAIEEDEAEEASIDGEELNPFGDRWEE